MSINDPRKITGMPLASSITGDELLEVVQDGKNKRVESRNIKGIKGDPGKSAYQIAVENGYLGNQIQWLTSLKGPKGEDGGIGPEGRSAYQLAVSNGFIGTLTTWLESLKGEDGTNGTNGTNGTDGLSAYQQAVSIGFNGSLTDWLESLKGQDGEDGDPGPRGFVGKSAYEVAVEAGFTGSVYQWLESLKGDDGVFLEPQNDGGLYLRRHNEWVRYEEPVGSSNELIDLTTIVPKNTMGPYRVAGTTSSTAVIDDNGKLWVSGTYADTHVRWENLLPDQRFISVSADYYTSGILALDSEGYVWRYGYGHLGQHGVSPSDSVWRNTTPPEKITEYPEWEKIFSLDLSISFGIKKDNTLWSWGFSGTMNHPNGNLGLSLLARGKPGISSSDIKQVGNDSNWDHVHGGHNRIYGVKTNGDLLIWGWFGPYFYNGDNQHMNIERPTVIGNYSDITPDKPKLFFGEGFTLWIKPDGTLWVMGYLMGYTGYSEGQIPEIYGNSNEFQQIGVSDNWSHFSRMGGHYGCGVISKDGDYHLFGEWDSEEYGENNFYLEPFLVTNNITIKSAITPFDRYGLILSEDGKILGNGQNWGGMVGNGLGGQEGGYYQDYVFFPEVIGEGFTWIGGNYYKSIAGKEDGSIYVWGANWAGDLGISDAISWEVSSPLRLYTPDNRLDNLNDRIDYWTRYLNYADMFVPSNWETGPGWSWWIDYPLPVAGYPADKIVRDYSIDYDDWDFEEGVLYLDGDFTLEDLQCFAHLKEITYLSLYNDTLENLTAFSNVTRIDELEINQTQTTSLRDFKSLQWDKLTALYLRNVPLNNLDGITNLFKNSDQKGFIEFDGLTLDSDGIGDVALVDDLNGLLIAGPTTIKFTDFYKLTKCNYLEGRGKLWGGVQNLIVDTYNDLPPPFLNTLARVKYTRIEAINSSDFNLSLNSYIRTIEVVRCLYLNEFNVNKSDEWNPVFDFDTVNYYRRIQFDNNDDLTAVNLEAVQPTTIGDEYLLNISFSNNPVLSSITGLSTTNGLSELFLFNNPSLETVDFISSVESVTSSNGIGGKSIVLRNNASLKDLSGLNNITSLSHDIEIENGIQNRIGFVPIAGSAWLCHIDQANKYSNGNQALVCEYVSYD